MNNFRDARLLLVDDEDYLITSMYKFLKKQGLWQCYDSKKY